ncbi:ATP-binding protein [Amycolatopsis sp. FDAARGOS 1241]|uniref:ATP-binding protein n=1 Tax=Amycolatopsis sp. FDAARGOS 1241 TaxID=2778070 RepID=UPI0019516848|nr:ATP-binding protein [Amycolatopsis sp. FDAARGOS 1241]QRP49315.1 ATP-binding protein [Amycolatopsis sp. FDAARGOS 1241]
MDNDGAGSSPSHGMPAVDKLLDEVIELRLPAETGQIPLVRMLAQAVAARADYGLDSIADAKMAVDEACAQLVELADLGSTMTCRFRVAPDCIEITVATDVRHARLPSERSFGWHVLTTLAAAVSATSIPAPGAGNTLTIQLSLGPETTR